jgi:hypothetical protein
MCYEDIKEAGVLDRLRQGMPLVEALNALATWSNNHIFLEEPIPTLQDDVLARDAMPMMRAMWRRDLFAHIGPQSADDMTFVVAGYALPLEILKMSASMHGMAVAFFATCPFGVVLVNCTLPHTLASTRDIDNVCALAPALAVFFRGRVEGVKDVGDLVGLERPMKRHRMPEDMAAAAKYQDNAAVAVMMARRAQLVSYRAPDLRHVALHRLSLEEWLATYGNTAMKIPAFVDSAARVLNDMLHSFSRDLMLAMLSPVRPKPT